MSSNWKDVIEFFLLSKQEAEEEKYLRETIKNIKNQYEKENFYESAHIKSIFEESKNKEKFESPVINIFREKFLLILGIEKAPEAIDLKATHEDYLRKKESIVNKYEVRHWVDQASKNAGSISFATHVSKLTHSKINSMSVYDSIASNRSDQLVTASLTEMVVDGAVSGNQYAPIFQFLELELKGVKLAAALNESSNNCLSPFAINNEELTLWNKGFRKALSSDDPSSHSLAKQIYFPVGDFTESKSSAYHLLCHLKSSSLAHAIYLNLFDKRNSNGLKKQYKEKKYSAEIHSDFPRRAELSVTASNHSNASQLNGARGGKLHLFSCQPPSWSEQLKSPTDKKSFFRKIFTSQSAGENVDYLRNFLLRFEKANLSIRNPERRKYMDKWVNNIIDELLNYAASIQELPPGWSANENCQLQLEYQYLLDPCRNDEKFQNSRKLGDWQSVVCDDFARSLNKELEGKDKKFTPQTEHRTMWRKLITIPLRDYNELIENDSTLTIGVVA